MNEMRTEIRCGTTARSPRRAGFTLVEMLVTIAVTLVVMLALTQMFQWIGERVADGRAAIELAGSLRAAEQRLQLDLAGLTVAARPWPGAESAGGYLEIIERAAKDDTTRLAGAPAWNIVGDRDDILAFTSHSRDELFVGRLNGSDTRSSTDAEIWWWAQADDVNGNFTLDPEEQTVVLHRRSLVIRPDLNGSIINPGQPGTVTNVPVKYWSRLPTDYTGQPTYGANSEALMATHLTRLYQENDLSFRLDTDTVPGAILVIANSLSDLTNRKNRWLRQPVIRGGTTIGMFDSAASSLAIVKGRFPSEVYPAQVVDPSQSPAATLLYDNNLFSPQWMALGPKNTATIQYGGPRQGEDVILGNVLAFDLRVFDPTAVVRKYQGVTLTPGDPSYGVSGVQALTTGCFVDLAHGAVASTFSASPVNKSQMVTPTYDTWSREYEEDGLNQDNDMLTDEANNGFDDDATNGTDDPGERETAPPYVAPLRGIEVRIRVYEPDTRQVRQGTVISNFVPD